MVVAAPRRAVAGIEVAGNDDADGLHPARHVGDAAEPAFGEELVVIAAPGLGPRRLTTGLFDAEEIEPFVVLVVASGDRGEIVSPATGETRRRTEFRFGAASASARPSPRGAAAPLRLGPFRSRLTRRAGGPRRRAFPVAATPAAAAPRFSFATAVGSGAGRSGGTAVAGGEWFVVRGVVAAAHWGRLVSDLFRGGAIFARPFPAPTTAAPTTAAAAAAAPRLLVAGIAPRFSITGEPVTPADRFTDRFTGLQVDAAPVVVVPIGPPGGRPIRALGTGRGGSPVDRRIPIKPRGRGRLLAARRWVAVLAVTVAGGTPFAIDLATRGSRTSFLSGGVLGRPPRLETELVVGRVFGSIVGPIIVLRAASRCVVLGPRPFAPRCVVAIPASAAPSAPASPAATAAPRFAVAPVPLGTVAIFEDPPFGRIDVVDRVVIRSPAGVTILGPGRLTDGIAAPRRTKRLGTGLIGSDISRTLGAGAIPGRSPRGIPRLGALAMASVTTASVTAASPARGTTTVTATFAAAVVFPSARGRTVGRAPVGAPIRTTLRTPVNDRAILEAEVVGTPIGGDVARREIPGGSLRLRETVAAPVLPLRTALERFRRRQGGPFAGGGRRGNGRGGPRRNRVWLEAQAGNDVGPVPPRCLGSGLLRLGAPRLDDAGGSGLRSGGGLGRGLVRRGNGAEAVGEGGPRIVCFRHGSDGFLDSGGSPKRAPWNRQG